MSDSVITLRDNNIFPETSCVTTVGSDVRWSSNLVCPADNKHYNEILLRAESQSVRTHSKHTTNAWTNTTKHLAAPLEQTHQSGCRFPSTRWSLWRCPPSRCPRTARSRWSVWPTPPSVRSEWRHTRLLISSDWDNDGSQHDMITITLHCRPSDSSPAYWDRRTRSSKTWAPSAPRSPRGRWGCRAEWPSWESPWRIIIPGNIKYVSSSSV